jgi:DnaJ-class molecular chaperone
MEPSSRELLAYLDRVEPALDRLTHFELLDVERTADGDAIQRAFHRIAARMHPDRHRAHITPAQHERLNIVYGRIAEAYRVLRSDLARQQYLAQLAASDGTQGTVGGEDAARLLGPKAQRLYRRAQAELRRGDVASAVLNLKMALRADPGSALLVQALAAAEQRVRGRG